MTASATSGSLNRKRLEQFSQEKKGSRQFETKDTSSLAPRNYTKLHEGQSLFVEFRVASWSIFFAPIGWIAFATTILRFVFGFVSFSAPHLGHVRGFGFG